MKKNMLILMLVISMLTILIYSSTVNALSFFAINSFVNQDIVQEAIVNLDATAIADVVAVAVNIAPVIQTAINVAPTIQNNIQISGLVNFSPIIEFPDINITMPENIGVNLNLEMPKLDH